MIHLNIGKKYQELNLSQALTSAAATALDMAANREYEVSLALIGDEEIKKLNSQFLDEDRATDVLSFPAGENEGNYLGDIVISLPRAAAQAKSGGHSLEEELQLLTVHGILHLLGYDHATTESRDRMWDVQSNVLKRIGVDITTKHVEQLHSV